MQRTAVLQALLVVAAFASAVRASAQERPLTTEPTLRDPNAIGRELGKRYPYHYERAGVGGTVRLTAFIDSAGKADSVRTVSSSGVAELDVAASSVVRSAAFVPARGPGGPTAAWIAINLNFGDASPTESPRLVDRSAVESALQTHYPRDLRASAINVEVVVVLTIDSAGSVVMSSVPHPGCFPTAVEAARRSARQLVFAPAEQAGQLPRQSFATIGFVGDTVRLKLRGDSDPPPKPSSPDSVRNGDPPFRIPPELKNTVEIQRALMAAYPRQLRDEGIGGDVSLRLLVNPEGRVARLWVVESSGICDLDLTALKVSRKMRFSPAMIGGNPIPVWVQMPRSEEHTSELQSQS